MSLKTIKGKIRGIDKTHKVTKAMEAVSAVKMRKSQERALSGRPYASVALSILMRVGGSLEALKHPLATRRDIQKLCIVVITSDKGLAGNLNSAVIKGTERYIRESGLEKGALSIMALGRKGRDYFTKRGYHMIENTLSMNDDLPPSVFSELTEQIANTFTAGLNDRVVMVYNQFRSTFEQNVVVHQLLPLSIADIKDVISGITPEHGKYAENYEEQEKQELYTIEPDTETVLNTLLPYLLQIELYHSLLEAKASEHSARMVAMKNASDKARDLSKELTRSLNKARQAQITREISEIIGGIEAMKV